MSLSLSLPLQYKGTLMTNFRVNLPYLQGVQEIESTDSNPGPHVTEEKEIQDILIMRCLLF